MTFFLRFSGPFHFPIFGITDDLIKGGKECDHKSDKAVFITFFADKRTGESIDGAPNRPAEAHLTIGIDPLSGLEGGLAVEAG